ncbi:MAG: FAD-binding oxidoreductase [Bryobacteraceae bacterium]
MADYLMSVFTPQTPEEMASCLAEARSRGLTITLIGSGSKNRMAGPVPSSDVCISTTGLRRVLQYEPQDLTISVEAGLPWRDLTALLAGNRQMVPLDPPFAEQATVGGVLAANSSGPRRRLYGTARDLVIGMKFATLEGKLVQSGGTVVKNVAGLDMGKLMIGSFGTLAAMAVVNFKLMPMPAEERTFLLRFNSLDAAFDIRDAILKSVLQPAAIDLIHADEQGLMLAIRAGGNAAVVERYQRELGAMGDLSVLEGDDESDFWQGIREFTPRFLARHDDGAVVRVSAVLTQSKEMMERLPKPAVLRAGSGVGYACFARCEEASQWLAAHAAGGWKAIMESAPENRTASLEMWPTPQGSANNDFELMKRVKRMFDPHGLLNRDRLYCRI